MNANENAENELMARMKVSKAVATMAIPSVISTIHGLDWAREKWRGSVASKFIRGGEKNAVKYADEIIVLSKDVQKYFMDTYGRETHFMVSIGQRFGKQS